VLAEDVTTLVYGPRAVPAGPGARSARGAVAGDYAEVEDVLRRACFLDLTKDCRSRKVLLAPRRTERRKAGRGPGEPPSSLLAEGLACDARFAGVSCSVAGGCELSGYAPESFGTRGLTRRMLRSKV
jgi:hypothetical protein